MDLLTPLKAGFLSLRIPLVSQRHHGHRTTPKLHVGVHVGEVYITRLGEKQKVTLDCLKKTWGKNNKYWWIIINYLKKGKNNLLMNHHYLISLKPATYWWYLGGHFTFSEKAHHTKWPPISEPHPNVKLWLVSSLLPKVGEVDPILAAGRTFPTDCLVGSFHPWIWGVQPICRAV